MISHQGKEHCAVGGIQQALVELNQADKGMKNSLKAAAILELRLGRGSGSVPSWNDEKDRTYGDVRDELLRTAKALRNNEPIGPEKSTEK